MFENFPEPWKGTDKYVKIVFRQVQTGISYIGGTGTFANDSLCFSSDTLCYQLEVLSTKKIKYRRTITFPLKYIKFFEIGELFDNKEELPRSYEVVFYIDLTSDSQKEIKLERD